VSARGLLRPLLVRLLERPADEIERRADRFAIDTPEGRELVARLGEAFLGGYHAMLRLPSLGEVARRGAEVAPHYRPFFFEGAAMGYLPRGYYSDGYRRENVERDLLEMHPGFRYLYYVGLGFWQAIRHPRRPAIIEGLAPHLDPMYVPLCYDGFGFKVGFFDYSRNPARARALLDQCPPAYRPAVRQGFGRSLFFVFMDDDDGFRRERDACPAAYRLDMETGRSLATAFTGVDRPARIAEHLDAAAEDVELRARLTGVTWALAARQMNDGNYFEACMASAPRGWRDLLGRLPGLCSDTLQQSAAYDEWQGRAGAMALEAYRAAGPARSGS
jgi:hypothetical protein